MPATMAPKKRRPGRPKGTLRKPNAINVNAWLNHELGLAFERFVDDQRPRVTRTSAVEQLFEEALTIHGYWPPPSKKAPER